ncbi:glycosyltransferase family 4 protein [Microbacterium tumbae]
MRDGTRTILLVSDYSLAYMGGAQTAMRRQAEALLDAGLRCVVLAPGTPLGWDPRVTIVSPPVRFTLPVVGLPVLGPADSLTAIAAAAIREHDVTGVVLHSELALAAAALRAARESGIRTLHIVHTFFWRASAALSPLAPLVTAFHTATTGLPRDHRCRGTTAMQDALRSMTLRVAMEADAVVSPSRHQAEALRTAGVARVEVLSNVVEPVVETAPGSPGVLTVLWAARFAPEKRLGVALEAMRMLRDRIGPGRVHLHVAGGWHRPAHDVTFHAKVDARRIDELIAGSDAVVLTSLGFDNQPMIALEAFRRGRPVIVSDPALAREFGAAAIQAPSPDAAGLASALQRAWEDRELLAVARSAASAYALERGADAHVRGLLALLDSRAARVASA